MEKILITLEIPSMGEKYDLFAPVELPVGKIVPLLAEAVEELSAHRFVSSGQELLCSAERGTLFSPDGTLSEYGVRNGDCLMLF